MRVQSIDSTSKQANNYRRVNPSFKRDWSEHISWGANYIKETGKTNFKLFSFPDARAVFVEVASKAAAKLGNIKERVVQVFGIAGLGLAIQDIKSKDDETTVYPMEHKGDGVYETSGIDAKPDDKYRYVVVDKNNNVNLVKDPYSKRQESIHGWSSIYDKDNYEWKNTDWIKGKDSRRIVRKPNEPLRGLENLIIDEINIPTLNKEGTFESAKERIDVISDRGVATAIEILPVENTFSKQWGYDGVDKFAVSEVLGGPAKLKELIDYAHGKGLNVIMDMVPNHMGPDGDYLAQTGPYEKGPGGYGSTLNYEGKDNRYVRDWMANAALWWANEFKVDGIRFDMTKLCESDYLLKQIISELNEHNPDVFTIAEDGRENKLSVTRYEIDESSHKNQLEFIDTQVGFIADRGWRSTPGNIGFDSEWDFPLMHALSDAVIHTNQVNLGAIDELLNASGPRVKYIMSHDEIGNVDGTRLIPKSVSQYLYLFENMEGPDDAIRGQKAAALSQDLVTALVTDKNLNDEKLSTIQRRYGLRTFVNKQHLETAFDVALAKNRLGLGTVMTIPGPKMYFQGDDNAELSRFKFFRELSDEREDRIKNPVKYSDYMGYDKPGYDSFIDEAMPDSIMGIIKPVGKYENMQQDMVNYSKALKQLLDESPALRSGEIFLRYNEHDKSIHVHGLRKGDEELVVIKNFSNKFYDGDYSTLAFPKHGNWVEILNSDDEKFGGGGKTNKGKEFSDLSQNLNLAENSIIVLKRVS